VIPDADDLPIPCQCAQLGRDGPGINQAGSDALAFCIKVMRLPFPSTLIPAFSGGVVPSKAMRGHPKKLYREKPDEDLTAPSESMFQKGCSPFMGLIAPPLGDFTRTSAKACGRSMS